ncbi:MAG: NAD(P)/FAD-dependent oxidoreductase [Myxococcales bacterium]|nr:NAD(P)/FAD-dependent oxidoreductase [Myxococcales bacterium]
MHDAIVIGSGAGGLAAALTLAQAGRSVLVLEACKQFGGFLNPFARKKFHFDTGVHYVGEAYPGGSLSRTFERFELGIEWNELTPDGFDWYVFPDYEVKLCKGRERFQQRLSDDFPAERDGIASVFALITEVETALRTLSRIRGPVSLGRALPHLPALVRWGRATLAQLLDHYLRDQRLKNAFAGPCGDLGLPPSRLSGLYHLALLAHYLGGGFYPKGGAGAIRDAYLERLAEHGAELHRNAAVAEIEVEGGRAVGVRTRDGHLHRARVIVSNLEGVATYRMAGIRRSGMLAPKLQKVEPSHGSFMVFLGVEGDLAGNRIGDNNVWHYASADIDALYARVARDELPSPDACFITIPSLKDPDWPDRPRAQRKAPEGHHIVELVTLASPEPFRRWFGMPTLKRGAEYDALKQRLAEPFLELAEQYIPGVSSRVVIQEVATPATNAHYVQNDSGQIYGPAHTPSQVLLGRFPAKTPLDGLYLCGASVIGCGVMPCTKSGVLAGRLALRELDEQSASRGGWRSTLRSVRDLMPI